MVLSKPRQYYQAIILDIDMPIMNGIEACEKIQTYLTSEVCTGGIPFVYALTSESDQQIINDISAAGFKAIFHNLDQAMIRQIKEDASSF